MDDFWSRMIHVEAAHMDSIHVRGTGCCNVLIYRRPPPNDASMLGDGGPTLNHHRVKVSQLLDDASHDQWRVQGSRDGQTGTWYITWPAVCTAITWRLYSLSVAKQLHIIEWQQRIVREVRKYVIYRCLFWRWTHRNQRMRSSTVWF